MRKFLVFGANTDIGKTVVTAGLVRAATKQQETLYVKPLQTGTDDGDSDELFVRSHANQVNLTSKTLFSWGPPVSPHIAAYENPIDDQEFLAQINSNIKGANNAVCFIETAGGVLSPTASGTLQADVYLSIDTKVLLIADGKLGGISATLCAYESLSIRGYDVNSIIGIKQSEEEHGTLTYLKELLQNTTKVHSLPNIPEDKTIPLNVYYKEHDTVFSKLYKSICTANL